MNETNVAIEAQALRLRAVIKDFLQARLQPKLEEIKKREDKLPEGDHEEQRKLELDRQQRLEAYELETWIADAAKRAGQIQQATHALKFTHPDARGSSLNTPGHPQAGDLTVGTHTLGHDYKPDVVGNAAQLDVYKFLCLEADGETLLKRAIRSDPALSAALSADAELAESWIKPLADITRVKGVPATHRLAKQLYWPLSDGEYHLLGPLFPSSLLQRLREIILADRFSEEAKAARSARRDGKQHHQGYREYPGLAIQKFGGTKPQNISQLNAERHGESYLLPSCPPIWKSKKMQPPLKTHSVFDGPFGKRKRVRRLTGLLRDFLLTVRDVNNVRIRFKRAELTTYIRDELLQFAAECHELPPGWSQHHECLLNLEEQCWLDPYRAHDDQSFAAVCRKEEWQDAVCRRFGNWLNARLSRPELPMGQDEAKAWQSFLDQELKMLHLEIDYHD